MQRLEVRLPLTGEGELLSISRTFDTTGLLGDLSASVRWGDGVETAATVQGSIGSGSLNVKLDYSFDTARFFSNTRRAVLSAAVDAVMSQFTDQLAAIAPSGTNTWTALPLHPETGRSVAVANPRIEANEILIYVGSRDMGSGSLAIGGPGGFQASGTQTWLNTVQARGQSGALATQPTDFGPWGGSLSFNSSINWYFGTDVSGLRSNQFDFVSVAMHELIHLLGFGTSASWSNLVSGGTFTGVKARAAHDFGGNPPLSPDNAHWPAGLTDQGQPTLMDPEILAGQRTLVAPLDMAAMDDIGWRIATSSATVTAEHVYPDNGTYPVSVTLQGSRVGQLTQSLNVNVTNVAPTLTLVPNQSVVTGEQFTIANLARISDPGFANPLATPPTAETFTYSVDWGDDSAPLVGAARIDRVGQADLPTLASFDAAHTYAAAGNYTVRVTVADDDGGVASGTFVITAADRPRLALAIDRSSFGEDAERPSAMLTVSRPAATSASAITVMLSSSDTTEATLPESVALAPGQLMVQVPVDAVDDDLLDGPQSVTLTASATGFDSGSVELVVTDAETLTATLSASMVLEDAAAGSVLLTVRRSNTDTQSPLNVSVAGNDDARIALPTTIIIPAGSQQVVIPVDPIDDDSPQRSQLLQYQFTAPGYASAAATLTLLDDEPPRFQNPLDRFDVDGDGQLLPLDALRILIFLAGGGPADLDPQGDLPDDVFVDVNGDYQATPLDALLVLSEIGRRRRLAGTEAEQPQGRSAELKWPEDQWAENQWSAGQWAEGEPASIGTMADAAARYFPEIGAAPHSPELHPHAVPQIDETGRRSASPWLPAPFQKQSS